MAVMRRGKPLTNGNSNGTSHAHTDNATTPPMSPETTPLISAQLTARTTQSIATTNINADSNSDTHSDSDTNVIEPPPAVIIAKPYRQSPHASPRRGGAVITAPLLVDSSSKWESAKVRFYTTFLMLGGFCAVVYAGHIPLVILVFACQFTMYREIKHLTHVLAAANKKKPLVTDRPLHWFWFASAIFFTYGRIAQMTFTDVIIPYHSFISFALYSCGVILFVFTLQKGYYKYQFETFAWIHLTLLLIVVQSAFVIMNMFNGLIWFLLPALLIISNDSWAYVFGFFFGRTPLIQLSPKKTWEGFLGALVVTVLTGFLLPRLMSQYHMLICPQHDLSFYLSDCTPTTEFIPVLTTVPLYVRFFLPFLPTTITVMPIQYDGVVLAMFASLIAPFGGFFASGFKRAFRVKDFGVSIPGHGGVTDRMDCQIMMGLFVYVYYYTFVVGNHATPTSQTQNVWEIIKSLDAAQQKWILEHLQLQLSNFSTA